MERLKTFFEIQLFGVCEKIGEKLDINSSAIRKYFIYLSFITFGSPLIIYLFLAFWLEHRNLFKRKKSTIWEIK